jgi:altronate hydrolase
MSTDGLIRIETPDRPTPPGAAIGDVEGGPRVVRIHATDDVAVAVRQLTAGESVQVVTATVRVQETIAPGHKIALRDIAAGEPVVKYGHPIGVATSDIVRGSWVHTHNVRTRLTGVAEHQYAAVSAEPPSHEGMEPAPATFDGFARSNGRVGTRNEIWILNTVGCVNHAAERIARLASGRFAGVDGVYTFTHPYGCSQLGDDLGHTRKVLAGLLRNPNVGGGLLLGLGCENNQMDRLLELVGDVDRDRLRWFYSQDVGDEVEEGLRAIDALAARMAGDRRTPVPASKLVLGHKCGGSDGFSGISANAVVGRIADRVSALGGSVLLTEVPEMFGAEDALLNRAVSETVFRDAVTMIDDFKRYFIRHDQPIHENPSPGNTAGGLTTLEEKALGAIQKGGRAPVTGVLRYGDPVRTTGLSLLESPGNDAVSSTALVASGATVLLFTTGRGTPLGFPVPTLKISSNTAIAAKKPHWIDFNAGALLDGTATMEQLEDDLFALVLDVASGRKLANNETHGIREIAIWKDGVTL